MASGNKIRYASEKTMNELKETKKELERKIGIIKNLKTTKKTTLVDAFNELNDISQ